MESPKVEASLKKGKVCNFLEDLMALCTKHKVSITTDSGGTAIQFYSWDSFFSLDVDSEGASLYWPRIQTDIIVKRRQNEKPSEVASDTKETN